MRTGIGGTRVVDMLPLTSFDITGMQMARELHEELKLRGVELVAAGRLGETLESQTRMGIGEKHRLPIRHYSTLRKAVQAFRALPEAEALASANKRIRNILRKTTVARTTVDPALFSERAEKDLYEVTARLMPRVRALVEDEDYTEALRVLAGVRKEVDTFFDEVMVMTDEPLTRDNRLALLAQLEALMNQVADISRLGA